MQSPKRRAFTLIELLIAIAIISLLAAILFPVFGRARENARRSSCQSNLRQIMLGVLQYTQDYDETYVPGWINLGNNNFVHWPQLIQPYVKNQQIFQCPSDLEKKQLSFETNPAPGGYPNAVHTSYARNIWTTNTPTFRNDLTLPQYKETTGRRESGMLFPSTTIWLVDKGVQGSPTAPFTTTTDKKGCLFVEMPNNTLNNVSGTDPHWCAPNARHLETANVAFADGHVKALRTSRFYYADTPWLDPARGGN